jgi:hypothetical protein
MRYYGGDDPLLLWRNAEFKILEICDMVVLWNSNRE